MKRVYFIKPIGMAGPVKIGCSDKPVRRLSQLLAWSPFPLEICAVIDGDFEVESRFHAAFEQYHTHREWFASADEITACIVAINAGTFDIASLPAPASLKRAERGTGETPKYLHAGIASQLAADLASDIEAFSASHGIGPSTICGMAVGDPCLYRQLHRGRDVRPSTAAKVRAFMVSHNSQERRA